MGEQPLACQRKSCIFRDPRTHGFGTLLSEQQAVDKGSTCCHFVAGQRAGLVREGVNGLQDDEIFQKLCLL